MKRLLILAGTIFMHSAIAEFSATQYLQTNSLSQNVTETHIVNTSNAAQTFSASLYNGDGELQGIEVVALSQTPVAAKGRLIVTSNDLEQLFGVSNWQGPATLEIIGSGPFEIMSKLVSPSGLTSNTNCVRQTSVHNVEGFDSEALSFVRFINTGAVPFNNIRGTLYDTDGATIGTASTVLVPELEPKSAKWLTRDDLSTLLGDTWTGAAYLEVDDPPANLRLLNLNLSDNTFFNFSCYESAEERDPGAQNATFQITFVAEWSDATHADTLPGNAHFSPLVGVTHSQDVTFWAAGELASSAVESVAENGTTGGIRSAIQIAIDAGTAENTFVDANLNSPGSNTVTINASMSFPLISLISMIAPSPDWFVGTNSLNLTSNGEWLESLSVDLFAYDAGTEDGSSFSLSNPATSPAQPIARISAGSFPGGDARLGYFLIERVQ